ncbi:MAG: tetratricopeptide repeat protein [Patescibacteria group bacterium]|nr:tetratricopeptide repeat protein [Patescibacteria group bacterium]
MVRLREHGRFPFLGMVSVLAVLFAAASGLAVEESQKFLDALRERGLHEQAVYYLEKMADSPLASAEFKEKIDYEMGATLISAAMTGRVMATREKQLEQARTHFEKFVKARPGHPMIFSARSQLANLLVQRGRIEREKADEVEQADAREKIAQGARKLLDEAEVVFSEQEAQAIEEHERFPKFIPQEETKRIEERDQVRRDILESRMALAGVKYELALTYPKGSDGYKKTMKEAAERYGDVYEKYSTRLVGLYARMWEGRCYKELGDHVRAFEAFEELLEQPDEPAAFRALANRVMVLELETCLMPDVREHKKAMDRGFAWLAKTRGAEEASIEGLAVRYYSGLAAVEYAKGLKKDDPAEAKLRDDAHAEARKAFQFVARLPGDHQRMAKERLAEMGIEQTGDPATFAEARDRGKDELDKVQMTNLSEEDRKQASLDAVKYFRLALQFADKETAPDDVNVVRYYLAFLYWLGNDYHRAALTGEFLARRYPNGVAARQGAKIALAAYAKLFSDAKPGAERDWEVGQMVGIARFITKQWPDAPDAADAWMMLVRSAVVNRQLDQAREYLANIPEAAPQRGEAELLIGQTLWGEYARQTRLPEGEKPSQEQLAALVDGAKQILEAGVVRMKQHVEQGGEVTYTLCTAVLSLSQVLINQNDTEGAVKWLDDPVVGIVTLVRDKAPVTERGPFRVETYKAALRAYVGRQELDKAEGVMEDLEEAVKQDGGAGAEERLTQIYISLGKDLEQQLAMLSSENKRAEQKKVSEGFELFLSRILQRPGNTFSSLNWIAETFYGLGAGLDPGGQKLAADAEGYYKRAAQGYLNILKALKADPAFGPQDAELTVNIRLARCFRRLRMYEDALKLLLAVLEQKPMMIDAQVEAAYTYQGRGAEKAVYYRVAMLGSKQYPQFWGWGKVANRVSRSPKHTDVFHEARYNLAVCRLEFALTLKGEERTEQLNRAKDDIVIIGRLYPDMGGDSWRGKYNELFKRIQKVLGESPTGLPAQEKPKDAAPASPAKAP